MPITWFERYSKHFEETRLPQILAARQALADLIGQDGRYLASLNRADNPYADALAELFGV